MNKLLYIILISLFSLTVFSCSSDEAATTTATTDNTTTSSDTTTTTDNTTGVPGVSDPNTDAALGITGQTMTIGSIDYTTSMVSSCVGDGTTKAGVSVYFKTQFFVYDNKTLIKNTYFYSDSSCTNSIGGSYIMKDDFEQVNPYNDSVDNASVIAGSNVNVTGTVYDNSSNAIDNSTYFSMIYTCIGDGVPMQGGFIVYPKSTTELQMHGTGSCGSAPIQFRNEFGTLRMKMVYTPK